MGDKAQKGASETYRHYTKEGELYCKKVSKTGFGYSKKRVTKRHKKKPFERIILTNG